MFENTSLLDEPAPMSARSEQVRARWTRLAHDFARLPTLKLGRDASPARDAAKLSLMRDVGALLLLGHDAALTDAERYVVEGHTRRTGHVVDFDDVDDDEALAAWAKELDRASDEGWAPPAPLGFWASFLRWRTPMGMSRFAERRSRPSLD